MKLSLAIQTPEVQPTVPVALCSGDYQEKLAKAAQWGADGVELMSTEPYRLDWKQIIAGLQEHGLEAAAIASGAIAFALGLTLLHPDPQTAATARQRLFELIDLAQAVKAPLVTIGSFRGRAASVGENAPQQLQDILFEATEYAQVRSVRLVLEPLNRFESDILHTAEQALKFLNEINHPSLGLLLDTFHVNIEEASWTEPYRLALQAGRLWHVHLGDNNRLAPGWGLIDFAAIVKTLRENGYNGYLSAELLAKPDADSAAQQTLSHMRTILKQTV